LLDVGAASAVLIAANSSEEMTAVEIAPSFMDYPGLETVADMVRRKRVR
jgi:DNA-binding protein YbaB